LERAKRENGQYAGDKAYPWRSAQRWAASLVAFDQITANDIADHRRRRFVLSGMDGDHQPDGCLGSPHTFAKGAA
jgi:hypothetical protein